MKQSGCMSTVMMVAFVNRWELGVHCPWWCLSGDIIDIGDDFWMIAIVENAAQHDTTGETWKPLPHHRHCQCHRHTMKWQMHINAKFRWLSGLGPRRGDVIGEGWGELMTCHAPIFSNVSPPAWHLNHISSNLLLFHVFEIFLCQRLN